MSALNERQREAVSHDGANMLVVAGPGSGKTRVLAHRVARLIADGEPPYRLLAVTFTNKAAAELRERITTLVGDDAANRLWTSTFHSFCVRVLRDQHARFGLPARFTIVDADESARLIREAVVACGLVTSYDPTERTSEARALAKSYQAAISSAKNDRADIMERSDLDGLVEVARSYEERLHSLGAVDFDDLLTLTAATLEADDADAERWRTRFTEVLVDEYQDTNIVQLDILRSFHRGGARIVGVGDLDQAIFGFRGARPEQIATFVDDFAPASVVALDRNYRSTQPILDVCAAVIAANSAPFRATPWTDRPGGDMVVGYFAPDDRAESGWVADDIVKSTSSFETSAILVRTLAQTRVIEQVFAERNVPFNVVGGVEFYRRAEVLDTMAWLRVAVNGRDWNAFVRAVACPRRGVGAKTLAAFEAAFLNTADIVTALNTPFESGRVAAAATALAADITAVHAALPDGPTASVEAVLNVVGVRAAWAKERDAETRLDNLAALIDASAEFEANGFDVDRQRVSDLAGADAVAAFATFAALNASVDHGDIDGVQIMTIHAAKGREFDSVYVMGCEENILPHQRSLDSVSDLAEERRLMYVACSRAERLLRITWSDTRYMFGRPSMQRPSRFIDDIAHLIDIRSPRRTTTGAPSRHTHSPQSRSSLQPSLSPPPARQVRPVNSYGVIPASTLTPGLLVVHQVFGDGVVETVSGQTVAVRFATSTKQLAVDLAPMRVRTGSET